MGFTSDQLKSSITHIERLASTDGGQIEVYLIELKAVMVSITQKLAQAFRNLSVQFPLLVLTDDYQHRDFVLVERYTAAPNVVQDNLTGFPTPAAKQVRVRPRVLTVNRLKPSNVARCVLRRFSYTESDSFAQYDKLLSAYVVADWSEPFFNNRALFSDYYLLQRLPDSPVWQSQINAAHMTSTFQALRDLYEDARDTFANASTSVARTTLVQPALTLLGFTTQPVAKDEATAIEPTYRLYTPMVLLLFLPWLDYALFVVPNEVKTWLLLSSFFHQELSPSSYTVTRYFTNSPGMEKNGEWLESSVYT